ncbi:hypothetical protein [Arthrobacter sp. CJ23]|uniref:hypothetical protein n=1 Tax=Arthrobacter sp. CJ23 TaxID=2972479 RepID=UPI00215BD066|nr:hypothetical protein [Arthrobacter sp. CJ23]UVJ40771.1 hypothetical protein NVV90_06265 [Arthrobacter sp. CJ23]
MTLADAGRRPSDHDRMPEGQPKAPACGRCGPGTSLSFLDYIPEVYATDGSGLLPPSASYTCVRCGETGSHRVPTGWAPPGWHWYS